MGRRLHGSVGDDFTRATSPYDTGLGFSRQVQPRLHGREVTREDCRNQTRNACTSRGPESVGRSFAAMNTAGNNVEDISILNDCRFVYNFANQCIEYRADKVLTKQEDDYISSGRIHPRSQLRTMVSSASLTLPTSGRVLNSRFLFGVPEHPADGCEGASRTLSV